MITVLPKNLISKNIPLIMFKDEKIKDSELLLNIENSIKAYVDKIVNDNPKAEIELLLDVSAFCYTLNNKKVVSYDNETTYVKYQEFINFLESNVSNFNSFSSSLSELEFISKYCENLGESFSKKINQLRELNIQKKDPEVANDISVDHLLLDTRKLLKKLSNDNITIMLNPTKKIYSLNKITASTFKTKIELECIKVNVDSSLKIIDSFQKKVVNTQPKKSQKVSVKKTPKQTILSDNALNIFKQENLSEETTNIN